MTRIYKNDQEWHESRVREEDAKPPTAWIGSTVNHALQCFHIASEDDLMDGLKRNVRSFVKLNASMLALSRLKSTKTDRLDGIWIILSIQKHQCNTDGLIPSYPPEALGCLRLDVDHGANKQVSV